MSLEAQEVALDTGYSQIQAPVTGVDTFENVDFSAYQDVNFVDGGAGEIEHFDHVFAAGSDVTVVRIPQGLDSAAEILVDGVVD